MLNKINTYNNYLLKFKKSNIWEILSNFKKYIAIIKHLFKKIEIESIIFILNYQILIIET